MRSGGDKPATIALAAVCVGAALTVAAATLALEHASVVAPTAIDAPVRQTLLIPMPGQRLRMHTVLLRPRGDGPFPLAVINHGSSQSSWERASFKPPEYHALTRWFLERGYVVALPVRPGHAPTGGPYFEDQGRCATVDYEKAGRAVAQAIVDVIDFLTAEPFVKKSGVVVVGQSAGGWGALALASRNPRAVGMIVNFAGGRGGHVDGLPDNNCAPDRLVEASGEFGRAARVPTLWIYAENDSYFAPPLSERMFDAYQKAGGVGEYALLPQDGADGHFIIDSPTAAPVWSRLIAEFQHSSARRVALAPQARTERSGAATVANHAIRTAAGRERGAASRSR